MLVLTAFSQFYEAYGNLIVNNLIPVKRLCQRTQLKKHWLMPESHPMLHAAVMQELMSAHGAVVVRLMPCSYFSYQPMLHNW